VAKVQVVTIPAVTETIVKEPARDEVTLTLTNDEATAVAVVLGVVSGDANDSPRALTSPVWLALSGEGFTTSQKYEELRALRSGGISFGRYPDIPSTVPRPAPKSPCGCGKKSG
jgi:hypothetical protein